MPVRIVPKTKLDKKASAYLRKRLAAPEHRLDHGPIQVWDSTGYCPNLFVAIESSLGIPIGVLYRAGQKSATDAGWWLDSRFRGRGYGSQMIDTLAALLKEEGVTGIGPIRVVTHAEDHHKASSRLVSRLRRHFN